MGAGFIYVLTNPSFPEYVKIGYAEDPERRLKEFNRSECLPFAFRLYGTYEVPERLKDKDLHRIIDKLNPDLRAVETFDGKPRVREFYNMSAEDAWGLLEGIAAVSGTEGRLKLCALDEASQADEKAAEELAESGAVSFTEEDHLERTSRQTATLYRMLKERVLAFGAGVAVEPRKLYVSFTTDGKVFLATVLQRSQLKIFLNMKAGTLDDPAGLAEDMTGRGHWGAGDYQLCLAGEEELEAALPLIRQAFEAVKT